MTYTGKPGGRVKSVEVDTGLKNHVGVPVTVTVTDDEIYVGSIVVATQSGEAPQNKHADENELDHFTVTSSVAEEGGSMTLILRPLASVILSGTYKINYVIG